MPILRKEKREKSIRRNLGMFEVRLKIHGKSISITRSNTHKGGNTMNYKCFYCRKEVSDEIRGKKVRCPYCGNKVLIKERNITTKVVAR